MKTYAYFIEEEDSVNITNNVKLIKANNEKDCLWKIYLQYFNTFSKIFFPPYPYFKKDKYKDYVVSVVEALINIFKKYKIDKQSKLDISKWSNKELNVLKNYFFDTLEYSWSGYKKYIPDNPKPPSENGISHHHFIINFIVCK